MLVCLLVLVLGTCLHAKDPPTIIILGQGGPMGHTMSSTAPNEPVSSTRSGSSLSQPLDMFSTLASSFNFFKYGFGDRKKEPKPDGPQIIYIGSGQPLNRDPSNRPILTVPPPQPPGMGFGMNPENQISRSYNSPQHASSPSESSSYQMTYPTIPTIPTIPTMNPVYYVDYDLPDYHPWPAWH